MIESTPRYIVRPSESRVLIAQAVKIIGLCALFYGGIWINIYLLGWKLNLYINLLIALILLVMVAMDLLMQHLKAKKLQLELYIDKAVFKSKKGEQTVYWTGLTEARIIRSFPDRMLATAMIDLGEIKMPYVSNYTQIAAYIEKYRQYAVYAAYQQGGNQ